MEAAFENEFCNLQIHLSFFMTCYQIESRTTCTKNSCSLCKVSCFGSLPSPSLGAEHNGHVQNPAEELPGDLHRTRSFLRLKPINCRMNTIDCGFTYSTVASVTPFPLSQNPTNNIIPQVTRWKAYTCHFCFFLMFPE